MRNIKFKGETMNNEIIYGSLVLAEYGLKGKHKEPKAWIIKSAFSNGGWFNIQSRQFVKYNTVKQFTEVYDVNRKEIYDGDKVKIGFNEFSKISSDFNGEVKFLEGKWVVDNGEELIDLWQEIILWEII